MLRILYLAIALMLLTTCKKDREWNNPYDTNSIVDPQEWAPNTLEIEEVCISQRRLIWEHNGGTFEGFKIDRKLGNGEWVEAFATINSDLREWVDTLVEPDTNFIYQYRLYAFAGISKSESKLASAEVSFPYPTGITTTKLTDVSYKLNWTDNSNGEDGFKIDRKTGDEWVLAYGATLPNETEFIDTNVFANKSGIDLQYRVYAFYKNTKSRSISTSVNAQLTTPVNPTISVNSQTSITLNWEYNTTGHQGFRVDRQIGSDSWQEGIISVEPTQNTYTDNTINFATSANYTYRIYAYYEEYISNKIEVSIGLPIIETAETTNITATSATSGGSIISDGGAAIIARGVVWSTSQPPTMGSNQGITSNGSGAGSFTSNLTNLQPGTVYYLRAYATNSVGTSYDNDQTFTTLDGLPVLTTNSATSITATTATSGGNITSDGGFSITARGVVWSASQNPIVDSNQGITSNGTGTESFTSNLTGLTPNSNYYVRAYATNSLGTQYGNQLSFTTLDGIIILTTTPATSVTATNATSGGSITNDGGASITTRGICYSTSQNPTTANPIVVSGTGTGSFTANLTGLTSGTTYYVRAYATNSLGVQYGNQVNFSTPMPDGPGNTVTDADGNVYNTVWINNRQWTKENLKTTKYKDGTNIPLVTDNGVWSSLGTPAYCWYNNSIANKPIYGALYNRPVVTTGNLCPTGWHVPTDAEWSELIVYAGGTSVAGTKLRATNGWYSGGNGTDDYGFSALPGGLRRDSDGTFDNVGSLGMWWSCSIGTGGVYWIWFTTYGSAEMKQGNTPGRTGISVRCIKD